MNTTIKHKKIYRILGLAFAVVLSLGLTMVAVAAASPHEIAKIADIPLTSLRLNEVIARPSYATSGGQCMVDRFNAMNHAKKNSLECTSNDVRLASYTLVGGPQSCTLGDPVDVVIYGEFIATSAERWDVGVFVSQDGGTPNATGGECYNDFLHYASLDNTDLDLTGGSGPFYNGELTGGAADPSDTCGDIQQGVSTFLTTQSFSIICQDSNDNGIADVESCTVWNNSGDTSPSCTSELQTSANTTAKCTCQTIDILNLNIAPILHLRKLVTNDNGGTAVITDWTLSADGTLADNDLSGTSPVDSNGSLKPDTWTLSESGPSGYTKSDWVCEGDGLYSKVGDVETITLDYNQEETCTITNDDNAPTLKLVKQVTNDDGGTTLADAWTLTATGTGGFSGTGTCANLACLTATKGPLAVEADVAYALSESSITGYTAGDWSCTINGGAPVTGASITLALGDVGVCTITNDDNAPTLKLVKQVTNDNGGTTLADAWTLTATGTGGFSGTGTCANLACLTAAKGPLAVDANVVYALSESSIYGYAVGDWSCTINGGAPVTGASITLNLGDTGVCTINNNDIPGTIIVKKITKPADSGSFTFTTTGAGYTGFTLGGGQQNSQPLNAGTYTVQEALQAGWILTGIGGSTDPSHPYDCVVTGSGGSTGVGDLNTQTATIDLKIGDTVTCTFENTGLGVTRTQGFWATHTPLADIAWFGGSAFGHDFPGVANVPGIGDILICGQSINDLDILMGGFWSNVAKMSTGARRSSLDRARMQLLQQLLAAELNASAFGSVPSGGSGMFAAWESALCGTDIDAIKTALGQAASFNEQGDNGLFTPGVSADPKYARSISDYVFWDIWP